MLKQTGLTQQQQHKSHLINNNSKGSSINTLSWIWISNEATDSGSSVRNLMTQNSLDILSIVAIDPQTVRKQDQLSRVEYRCQLKLMPIILDENHKSIAWTWWQSGKCSLLMTNSWLNLHVQKISMVNQSLFLQKSHTKEVKRLELLRLSTWLSIRQIKWQIMITIESCSPCLRR